MIDWTHWHTEPHLLGGLVLLGWAYALATGPLRSRIAPGRTYPRAEAAAFYAALALFYLAVGSPLDQVGEQFLFSAHMAQHLLLVYPVAALALAGLPGWLVDAALPQPWMRAALRLATRPLLALPLYLVVTGVWHLPALYDLALQDKAVHVAEHLSFFGAALLVLWPVFSRSAIAPPLSPGGQILYAFAMMVGNTPLFAAVTFSRDVLYPTYEFAPRISTLSASEDQVLAGAMMQLAGVAVAIALCARAFLLWSRRDSGVGQASLEKSLTRR